MADEVVLERANATLDGFNNVGLLELTSRRLHWKALRLRLPLTALFGEKELSIPLDEIQTCRPVGVGYFTGFGLLVEAKGSSYLFRLFRWWCPVLLWWKLTRRWVARINEAKLVREKDAPT